MASIPCPNGLTGKHKWKFVKNATKTTATYGPGGARMRVTLVGVYECDCGARKTGVPDPNAPDNSIIPVKEKQ